MVHFVNRVMWEFDVIVLINYGMIYPTVGSSTSSLLFCQIYKLTQIEPYRVFEQLHWSAEYYVTRPTFRERYSGVYGCVCVKY